MSRESEPIESGRMRVRMGRPNFNPGSPGWRSRQGRLIAVLAAITICAASALTATVMLTRPPAATPSPGPSRPAASPSDTAPSEVAVVEPGEPAFSPAWFASETPSPSPTPGRTATPRPAQHQPEPSIPWEDSPGHALHIYGRVTDTAGTPLPGIEVVANDDATAGRTTTDVLGRYVLHVGEGLISLKFNCYTGMHANGWLGTSGFTYDRAQAAQFDMTAGDVSGADISIPPAMMLNVEFKDHAGVALPPTRMGCDILGVSVFGYPPFVCGVVVQPGDRLTVHFSDYLEVYAPGYYNAVSGYTTDPDQASVITVADKSLVITIVLPALPSISGQVSVAGGAALPGGLYVVASREIQGMGPTAAVNADGTYVLDLGTGTWWLQIVDSVHKKVIGYYGPGGFTADYAKATPLVVGGTNLTGIDIVLPA